MFLPLFLSIALGTRKFLAIACWTQKKLAGWQSSFSQAGWTYFSQLFQFIYVLANGQQATAAAAFAAAIGQLWSHSDGGNRHECGCVYGCGCATTNEIKPKPQAQKKWFSIYFSKIKMSTFCSSTPAACCSCCRC